MNSNKRNRLGRRQFVQTLTAAVATPALLAGAIAPALSQEKKKKPEAKKTPPTPPVPAEEEKLLKALREFPVPEGAEPAFAFRADWGARSR